MTLKLISLCSYSSFLICNSGNIFTTLFLFVCLFVVYIHFNNMSNAKIIDNLCILCLNIRCIYIT